MSAHEPTGHALPPPLPASAPPTTPGALPTKPPSWPNVVGGFSLGIGILGVLTHACGIFSTIFTQQLFDFTSMPGGAGAQFAAMQKHQGLALIGSSLNLLCALALTVAGIGLLQRRRWSIGLHTGWAVARLLAAIVTSILTFIMQQAMFATMRESGAALPAGAGFAMSFGLIGAVLGLLWMAAYPVFILIFLRLAGTRATFHHLR